MSGLEQHEVDLQRLRGFRLMDDDFMSKCFEENIPCTELVLSIVLGRNDLQVESVHTQYTIANLQGRSVRLDILATDDAGKRYNIEIQRADRGAGAKRARYNSSLLDANLLEAGADCDKLPETYVIFITEHDVLGSKLPIYHIDRTIAETNIKFGDDAHIIYVNGECKDDTPLGILMSDFCCTDPDDMKYDVLADRARYFKEHEEGVATMCKMMEDMRNEAKLEAKLEAKREFARRMLSDGILSIEKIAEYSGLSPAEVEELGRGKTA